MVVFSNDSIKRGGIDRIWDLKILEGMCEYNRERLTRALEIFQEARRDARDGRAASAEQSARQWIRYIENERNRLRQLAAAEAT